MAAISYLLQNPISLVVIFAGLGWVVLQVKNWWSNRKVNQLTQEERDLFKKIDAIPEKVEQAKPDELADYWNKKEKEDGN